MSRLSFINSEAIRIYFRAAIFGTHCVYCEVVSNYSEGIRRWCWLSLVKGELCFVIFASKEFLSFVDVTVRAGFIFLVTFIDVITIRKEQAIAKTGLLTKWNWLKQNASSFCSCSLFSYCDNVSKSHDKEEI
jgi:hypothetical protein